MEDCKSHFKLGLRRFWSALQLPPIFWCPGRELNPHSPCGEKDFKSFASADFATRASSLDERHCVRYSLLYRNCSGFFTGKTVRLEASRLNRNCFHCSRCVRKPWNRITRCCNAHGGDRS